MVETYFPVAGEAKLRVPMFLTVLCCGCFLLGCSNPASQFEEYAEEQEWLLETRVTEPGYNTRDYQMNHTTSSPVAEHNYYRATITLSWIIDDGYDPPKEVKRVQQYNYRNGKDSRKGKWFYRGTVVTIDGRDPSNDFEKGEQEALDKFFNRQ